MAGVEISRLAEAVLPFAQKNGIMGLVEKQRPS